MIRTTLCFVLLALVALAVRLARAGEETIHLKESPGRELTEGRCMMCHSLDYIEMNAAVMDRAAWQKAIRKMADRFGAPVSDQDAAEILEYLSTNYSAPPAPRAE